MIMAPIILALATLTLTACARDAGSAGQSSAAPPPAAAADSRRNVLFVGTSLTAGYGVGEDVAFPARIQEMIDAAALPYRVINAGISGETSAGGLRRIDWTLQQPADVLVLELGANDGLRGIDPREMRSNLEGIVQRARASNPEIALVIVGMEAPPNLGDLYTSRFRNVFSDLADEYDAALVPFLLDSVAAQPQLNIEDGIHPNVAGHHIIARTVWRVLEPVLRTRAQRDSGDDS
jgi:acyl-CoA thioesterase-1